MRNIPLAKPQINWHEKLAVMRVLKSGNLTQGPEVKLFESEFSKIVGGNDPLTPNSN